MQAGRRRAKGRETCSLPLPACVRRLPTASASGSSPRACRLPSSSASRSLPPSGPSTALAASFAAGSTLAALSELLLRIVILFRGGVIAFAFVFLGRHRLASCSGFALFGNWRDRTANASAANGFREERSVTSSANKAGVTKESFVCPLFLREMVMGTAPRSLASRQAVNHNLVNCDYCIATIKLFTPGTLVGTPDIPLLSGKLDR